MIERGYMWRVALVSVVILTAWGGLVVRLGQLHFGDNSALHERIRTTRSFQQDIRVGRGRILDRNGNLLALDLVLQNVVVSPDVIATNRAAQAVSARLAAVLGRPYEQVMGRVNRPWRKYEVIERKVKDDVVEQVERLHLPGVWFEPVSTRHYPQNELACHVIGFVNFEDVGSGGIEQSWNSRLKGRAGMRVSEKDGQRHEIYTRRKLQVAPREGANVHLTLDQNVQYFTERALEAAMTNFHPEAAWAIVQEVRTGAILAMASRPAYDPNTFNTFEAQDRMNRAVSYNYEPGSAFKIGVVAAAINEGVVATNDLFDCEKGLWHYGGRPLRDYHAYDTLDVTGILRKSSNIGAAKIAVMLGEPQLYRYLKDYGLGRRTGIGVPGEEGGILNPVNRWHTIDITRIAMGHSVAVTALQMLGIMSCIGNDGFRMRPYLVQKVVDKDGNVLQETQPEALARPITERTAALMRQMLSEVTGPDGTGRKAAVPGYTVAGKTGTAEKIDATGRYIRHANISSFVGMLPVERPEVAIIVVLDNPQPIRTGGQTAAPVFREIAEPVIRYLDLGPVGESEQLYYQRVLAGEP
ncbi:MAG: penicillin-binding protein 2 [Kiritimatiellia bacterium]|nr:penicillin-binding protein 2 [Kiritimatiellia bacterium]